MSTTLPAPTKHERLLAWVEVARSAKEIEPAADACEDLRRRQDSRARRRELNGEWQVVERVTQVRDRLIRALLGIAIVFVPCMMYSNDIFSYISEPLQEKLPAGTHLIATGVMTPFTTPFKLSFFVASFIAMPWILYQLWAFVAPGLYRHEKRFAVPLLLSAAPSKVIPLNPETGTAPPGTTLAADFRAHSDCPPLSHPCGHLPG